VQICPDCQEPLVDKLPPGSSAVTPDENWVAVGMVVSQVKSEMAQGALESSNIPSIILSSTFQAYGRGQDWMVGLGLTFADGNVIMVPREHQKEALLVLEAVLGEDLIKPKKQ
jgi:hypothetical protein